MQTSPVSLCPGNNVSSIPTRPREILCQKLLKFYGILFSDSHLQVATFLPEGGGYDSVFHGKVVDMLHFPIWSGVLPERLPFFGGKYFSFFDPVFNIADMAISTGIGILIVFNKKAFEEPIKTEIHDLESHNNLT